MLQTIKSRLGVLVALTVLAAAGLFVSIAAAQNIFFEGFESQNFSKWEQVGNKWTIVEKEYAGKYGAHVFGKTSGGNGVLLTKVSTETYTEPGVGFYYKASGLDYRKQKGLLDTFKAEYSTDGVNWITILLVSGQTSGQLDGVWRYASASLPVAKSIQLRFSAGFTDDGDRVWIDNVEVFGTESEQGFERCSDGRDNDVDGYADETDVKCASHYATLSVETTGTGNGTVASTPDGITCGQDCAELYLKGTKVSLHQTTDVNNEFLNWGGACTGSGDCEVVVNDDTVVSAEFRSIPSYDLVVTVAEPTMGSVTSVPAGIDCGIDCAEEALENTVFALTADPVAGYRFASWSGACTGNTATCEVKLDGPKMVTATFEPIPDWTLTVLLDQPGQGTVVSQPTREINCGNDCTETASAGTNFSLRAIPSTGFDFSHWSGGCDETTATCLVTLEHDTSVTAHFVAKPAGTCGDGMISWNEMCDDGDIESGDGCSSTCSTESGFSCTGEPSSCFWSDWSNICGPNHHLVMIYGSGACMPN